MWIFIVNILLLLFYKLIFKSNKSFVIISSIQCFLLLALRSNNIGPDCTYYFNGFEYISNLGFVDMLSRLHLLKSASLIFPFKFESGYVFLNWIVSHLGFSYHFFIVICAFFNMYVFGKLIYKYSKVPWMSFVIFCTFGTYFYFFGILRQSLALCCFMLSFMAAMEGKKGKSTFLYIITFLFHRASIVLLPVLFLINLNVKITKKATIIMTLSSLPFIFLSKYLLNYVQIIVNYLNGGSYVGGTFGVNNLLIFLYIIMMLIILFVNFKKNGENKIFNVLVWALIITIYLDIMGQYNEVWERSVQLYTPFLILLIPLVVDQYRGQKGTILVSMCIVSLLTGYMVYYLRDSTILPYQIETKEIIFENN